MKIEVKITKEILEKSKYCGMWLEYGQDIPIGWDKDKGCHTTTCAVALAIQDIFPYSNTWNEDIYVRTLPDRATEPHKIILPKAASEFIDKFDSYRPRKRTKMKPFSFQIDIPEELINEIGIEEAREIIQKSETLEMV
jgi:hypothetical protein